MRRLTIWYSRPHVSSQSKPWKAILSFSSMWAIPGLECACGPIIQLNQTRLSSASIRWQRLRQTVEVLRQLSMSEGRTQAMRNQGLHDLSSAELVQQFAMVAAKQKDAILENDISESSRLVWRLKAIQGELKQRPEDQRSVLMQLYRHPNMQVR